MESLKLYEITTGFMQVMDKLENGELTEQESQEIQDQLQTALVQKSNNIIGYYQNQKALVEAIDIEIKRLQEMKKSINNNLDRYKEYVKSNMEILGIEKIETPVGKVNIAKNPISVDVLDESLIPEEYKEIVTTTKINKKAIADNFKTTGEIIEGVKINSNNTSLRIK